MAQAKAQAKAQAEEMAQVRVKGPVETVALVLIGFQNEFTSPGGGCHESVREIMESTRVLETSEKLVEAARARGALIVHAPLVLDSQPEDRLHPDALAPTRNPLLGIMRGLHVNRRLQRGSWGAQLFWEAHADDIVLEGMSGLSCYAGTGLDALLRQHGVRKVALCGFLANTCVESSMREAHDKGYDVVTLVDCCGATSAAALATATQVTYAHYSCPQTAAQFLASLGDESRQKPVLRTATAPEESCPVNGSAPCPLAHRWGDEPVLFEGWAHKKSRWLGVWRERWLVLTARRLVSFRNERGYQNGGERPTEEFDVAGFGPCVPMHHVLAVTTSQRALMLHFGRVGNGKLAAEASRRWITAIVDARSAQRIRAADTVPSRWRRCHHDVVLSQPTGRRVAAGGASGAAMPMKAMPARRRAGLAQVHAFEGPEVRFVERYEWGELLGQGGQAAVYAATCHQSGRRVAAKLKDKRGMPKAEQELLLKEVELLRKVDYHPNTVSIFNFFDSPSRLVIVMELLPHGTLYDHVLAHFSSGANLGEGDDGYTEGHVTQLLEQALSALAALRAASIVHRDLKPENVALVDPGGTGACGTLRLLDFGLAAEMSSPEAEELTARCGTPGYAAPELLAGRPYGAQVDVFSLGALLHTLLSGTEPFAAENNKEVLRKNARGHCTFCHPRWSAVSSDARCVVRRMLQPNPRKRATVHELLEDTWVSAGLAQHHRGCAKPAGKWQASLSSVLKDLGRRRSLSNA